MRDESSLLFTDDVVSFCLQITRKLFGSVNFPFLATGSFTDAFRKLSEAGKKLQGVSSQRQVRRSCPAGICRRSDRSERRLEFAGQRAVRNGMLLASIQHQNPKAPEKNAWPRMSARRNDDRWLPDLTSEDPSVRNDAIRELQDMLLRGLAKSLSKHGRVDAAFLDDVVQDASIKILAKLDTFQGRSKFRTWAVTVAVRTAVSMMRKREWRDVSLEHLTADRALVAPKTDTAPEVVEQEDRQTELLRKLSELIESDLTEKQWTAITAELKGMPLGQIAEKMGSNPNSLYKLLHDARKKLRKGLQEAGYTVDDVREAWT